MVNGEQGTMLYDAIYASSVGFKGESLVELERLSAARKITSDAGIVKSVLFLFDEIAKRDSSELLLQVRSFVQGTNS